MKAKLLASALLAGGVLAGCSADSENPAPAEETEEVEATEEEPVTTEAPAEQEAEAPVQEEMEDAEQAVDEAGDSLQDAADEIEEEAEQAGDAIQEEVEDAGQAVDEAVDTPVVSETAVEATGVFGGVADPHTVEIEVDGQPTAFQVEAGSDTMAAFEAMEPGQEVSFIYEDNGTQLVIQQLK